jgi:hypothetical protein
VIKILRAWYITKVCQASATYPGFQNDTNARIIVGNGTMNPAILAIQPKVLISPHQ